MQEAHSLSNDTLKEKPRREVFSRGLGADGDQISEEGARFTDHSDSESEEDQPVMLHKSRILSRAPPQFEDDDEPESSNLSCECNECQGRQPTNVYK